MPEARALDPVALIFLADDRDAQRLAVAWPTLGERPRPRKTDQTTFSQWAVISGVHIYEVRRLGPVLFEHGICSRAGTTDPLAMRYIRGILAKSIARGGKAKERTGG